MDAKYLVIRTDGSLPRWPYFVLGASDPASPAALRAYADSAEKHGMSSHYIRELRMLADEFERWRQANGSGDPGNRNERQTCQFVYALLITSVRV